MDEAYRAAIVAMAKMLVEQWEPEVDRNAILTQMTRAEQIAITKGWNLDDVACCTLYFVLGKLLVDINPQLVRLSSKQ